jgi:serine/threonine protein phosphatase PrpC
MAVALLDVDLLTIRGSLMAFDCVARTHVGCRRKLNEDALLARPDLGIWAVADGMGGHDAGEVASAMVVEALTGCDAGLDATARVAAAEAALHDVNGRLRAMGREGPEERTIGSTVVAIVADAVSFTCLWVGDSRAYRLRDGVMAQLTRDHSLVQELVDLGMISPAEAVNHPNGNVVTRAVGAAARLDIDQLPGDVLPGDVFLLASDGLTRFVEPNELLTGLQSPDLEDTAEQFVETVVARGAPDNLSFILLRAR